MTVNSLKHHYVYYIKNRMSLFVLSVQYYRRESLPNVTTHIIKLSDTIEE